MKTGSQVIQDESDNQILGGITAWETFTKKYNNDTIDAGTDLETTAANAVRVAFFQPTVTDDKNFTTAMTLGSSLGVWNPNSDKGFFNGNLASDYEKHLNSSAKEYTETSYSATKEIGQTIVTLSEVQDDGYAYAYLGVRIWLEGTDGDCFNYVLNDKIKIDLIFNGAAHAD